MELTVVPVILFLGVLLFSSPSQPARSKAPPAILMPPGMMISDTAMVPNPNYDFGEVEVTSNDELEFNTIMTYINQVYKKIPQEEATHFGDAADKIVWTKYNETLKSFPSTFIPISFSNK